LCDIKKPGNPTGVFLCAAGECEISLGQSQFYRDFERPKWSKMVVSEGPKWSKSVISEGSKWSKSDDF
jgi:hypothetical protein